MAIVAVLLEEGLEILTDFRREESGQSDEQ